jgi:hypothetical protein
MFKLIKDNILGKANGVVRLSDNACIPFDPDNTDYQAFLLWKSEGNEPLPAEGAE